MAIEFGKGIALAGGFDLGAKAPLDSRLTVATIEERDAHVTGNRAYDGMLVFVEADKVTYQYIINENGEGQWKEFGFNETDFLTRVANNLETDDASKALSAAQGVALKALIDAEAEAREEADETLQANIDALDTKIGVVPEGSATVIAYVNSKAQEVLDAATGGSSESAASVKLQLDNYIAENNPKVAANTTVAANAQSAAEEAMAHSEGVGARVDVLVGDDANKSVRAIANEELAKQLIAEGAQESLDTLAEIAAWIQEHPSDASAMNKAIEDLEALVGVLPEDVSATTIVAYIQEVVAAETSAREAAVDGLDERLQAVEAKFGDGDGNVEAQIVAAVAAEKAEREAADAQKADKTSVDTISGKVTTLEGEMAQAKTDIDTVEAAVATKAEQVDLEAEVTAREALDARVVVVEGKAHTHANADELAKIADGDVAKWNAISDDMTAYVDGEINKVEAVIGDIEAEKTVVQLIAEMREACEAGETQAVADSQAYTDEKIAGVNATIGAVEDGKTVVQLLAEAREAAVSSANEYTDDAIAGISATVSTLSETHAADVKALQEKGAEIEGNVTTLQDKVAALESVEHIEISTEQIDQLFQ